MGTAGDVNGDGYSDIIYSAPRYNNHIGCVWVRHGSAAGIVAEFAEWEECDSLHFGESVSTAGDVDGEMLGKWFEEFSERRAARDI